MINSRNFTFLLAIIGGVVFSFSTSAQNTTATSSAAQQEAPPEFTDAYLNDDANIKAGMTIWQKQCRHCHGASAYPGKAPKLKPKRYKPEFVFKRVTNGFRKMPPWKAVYSREERMAIVSYVLSKQFSP
jgi:mono/diheme cytochrome c family protein